MERDTRARKSISQDCLGSQGRKKNDHKNDRKKDKSIGKQEKRCEKKK